MDETPSSQWRRLRRSAVIAVWALRETLRAGWSLLRGPLVFALQVLAALFVLFEEWGWKPLSDAIAWLARFSPVARIESWIASLGPYSALIVFALPTTILLPLKFVAVWLLAAGMYWTASALFVGAKIASTALIARIFILTKPALMRVEWFARLYNWFVPWQDYFFAAIRSSWPWRYGRMVKHRIRHEVAQIASQLRPRLMRFVNANDTLRGIFERMPSRLRAAFEPRPNKPPLDPPSDGV